MRGKKGDYHGDPDDPPRRRANKQRGHGTYDNDRPPIVGTVGRQSGQVRLRLVHHTDQKTLENLEPLSIRMNGRATITSFAPIPPSATATRNGLVTTMAMASAKFTSIRLKGCGPLSATSYVLCAVSIKSISAVTLQCVSSVSISNG